MIEILGGIALCNSSSVHIELRVQRYKSSTVLALTWSDVSLMKC